MRCVRLVSAVVAALALVTAFTGCDHRQIGGAVKLTSEPVLSQAMPIAANKEGVALLSVDFEPLLRPDRSLAIGNGVSLLVAVDNEGSSVRRDTIVEAKLTGTDDDDVLATQAETIDALAPGEVRVIRFATLPVAGLRPQYTVRIAAYRAGSPTTIDDQRVLVFQRVAPNP